MTPLTKKQIHLLAAYEFKLWDWEKKWDIISASKTVCLICDEIGNTRTVNHKEIGTCFKILSRPLSSLTEPMENGEIPIVELAKTAKPDSKDWVLNMYGNAYNGKQTFGFDIDSFWMVSVERPYNVDNQQQLFDKLWSMHFCTFCPEDMQVDLRGV